MSHFSPIFFSKIFQVIQLSPPFSLSRFATTPICMVHCYFKKFLFTNVFIYFEIQNVKKNPYSSIFQINFVSNNDKWEVFWISWWCLNEELISPAVQRTESIWHGDIIYQNTAISTTVECHTQWLEPFLPCSIPDLQDKQVQMKVKFASQASMYVHYWYPEIQQKVTTLCMSVHI